MMLITRVVLIDIFQKLYLIKALIKKILIIFYNLHAYIHSCMEIMSLYCFTERSRSQILGHMIPTSYNSINDDREIFVFLKSSPAYKEITNIDIRETNDQGFLQGGNSMGGNISILWLDPIVQTKLNRQSCALATLTACTGQAVKVKPILPMHNLEIKSFKLILFCFYPADLLLYCCSFLIFSCYSLSLSDVLVYLQ